MSRLSILSTIAIAAGLLAAPVAAQSSSDESRFQAAQQRFESEMTRFRSEFDRYQSIRGSRGGGYYQQQQRYGDVRQDPYAGDRDENGYDAARYYRDDSRYQERTLSDNDRVYRGNDGRYYCKRSDGTTGLILGAAGGGILGNVIDGGHSRVVGTLLGGALGAIAGKKIDQNNAEVRCR